MLNKIKSWLGIAKLESKISDLERHVIDLRPVYSRMQEESEYKLRKAQELLAAVQIIEADNKHLREALLRHYSVSSVPPLIIPGVPSKDGE